MNVGFYLSHDIVITQNSLFWCEKNQDFATFTQRQNGRNYIMLLNL